MCASGDLAAVCDNLGRVLVVDIGHGIVRRVIKGCRDATVAWSNGSGSTSNNTLVILCPRRCVVEGFSLQREHKVNDYLLWAHFFISTLCAISCM